jgi:hypothetical protein
MAPAIAHFLIGASLLLLIALPFCLRYQVDREYGLWLIPVGGLWGITPDFHNIAPVFSAELYAFHNSPWVDLFGLHYTLDRPIVRAEYLLSVFVSILLFSIGVAVFWSGFRLYDTIFNEQRETDPAVVSLVSTTTGAVAGTVSMAVTVSILDAFDAVGSLVGSDSLIVGGLLLVPLGAGLGVVAAIGLEGLGLVDSASLGDPATAALGGLAVGVGCWLVGVVFVLPVWLWWVTDAVVSIPLVHWGSLIICGVFGTVFGGMYGLMKGTLSSGQPRRLWGDHDRRA